MTAHHWRALRLKLVLAGIVNPMLLSTMHILLDSTEAAVLESMSGEKDSEMRRTMFLDRLYAPSPEVKTINGKRHVAKPKGFDDDEVEASFDAFAQAAAR